MVAIILNNKGNTLARIDMENGTVQKLMEETSVPLSRPFPSRRHIFFSAGSEGINNIFALNKDNNLLYQVTNVRSGAFEPVVSDDGNKMLYSEYTADGYRVKEMVLEPDT